jgi:hypothetical protein
MVFRQGLDVNSGLDELSVTRDIEAGGYVVGFEDTGGSFVPVGRLGNLADDVTQPVEIKHQNSGERITLDSSGFETRSVTSTDSVTVTDGEATNTIHYGSNQDRANAGNNGVAIGIGARANSDNVTVSGLNSGKNNTGFGLSASGFNSALNNTGDDVTASGFNSAKNNTGFGLTTCGAFSAQNNTADNVCASGINSAKNNTGTNLTVSGANSARGDGLSDPTTMGDDNIGIGRNAIRNNQASGLIAIGQDSGISAQTDDQLIITDRNGNRRMEMDLTNGNLKIDGTLTENASL